jgi:hypothetical protein
LTNRRGAGGVCGRLGVALVLPVVARRGIRVPPARELDLEGVNSLEGVPELTVFHLALRSHHVR